MLSSCNDLGHRTDEQSFLFLTYVVDQLKGALESAHNYVHEDLSEQSCLRLVVTCFERVERRRADDNRMQWLARDWRFMQPDMNGQITEVLQYYRGLRAEQDADNAHRCHKAPLVSKIYMHQAPTLSMTAWSRHQ